MMVWLTGVRARDWHRDESAVETVGLCLRGWLFRWRQTVPMFLEGSQNDGFRQGSPDALRKANELGSDLIDDMLIVVMRCL